MIKKKSTFVHISAVIDSFLPQPPVPYLSLQMDRLNQKQFPIYANFFYFFPIPSVYAEQAFSSSAFSFQKLFDNFTSNFTSTLIPDKTIANILYYNINSAFIYDGTNLLFCTRTKFKPSLSLTAIMDSLVHVKNHPTTITDDQKQLCLLLV